MDASDYLEVFQITQELTIYRKTVIAASLPSVEFLLEFSNQVGNQLIHGPVLCIFYKFPEVSEV